MKNYHTIESYAINSIPNEFVFAGQGKLTEVKDISNFQDGRDLSIIFSFPANESKFNEYRVMVVKSENAENFNLEAANNVISENYFSFLPDSSDYNFNLFENSKDTDGELIAEFIPYKVFLLCIDTSGIPENNILYSPSKGILLTSPCEIVDNLNVTSEYIFYGNYNINLNFDKVSDESIISCYRIFIVNSSETDSLTLEKLNMVLPENYYNVNCLGTSYNINLQTNNIKDIHGNQLSKTEKYKAVIMTVANGNETNVNSYIISDNHMIFKTETNVVTDFYIMDVANDNTISNLEFSFKKAADESKILEYRIIITKADEFLTLEMCENITSERYFSVIPQNSDYNLHITSNIKDAQGDEITKAIEYKAYVLSVAGGIYSDFNSLSERSNTFAYINPNFIYNGYLGENIVYVDLEPDIELRLENNFPQSYSLNIFNSTFDFYVDKYLVNEIEYVSQSSMWVKNGKINWNSSLFDVIIEEKFNEQSMYFFSHGYSSDYCTEPYHVEYDTPFFKGLGISKDNYFVLGWVKLELNDMTTLKIYEYAYSTIPFEPAPDEDTTILKLTSFTVYPNPVDDILQIFLNNSILDIYTIEIFNTSGIKLYEQQYQTQIEDETLNIDLQSFEKEIYIMRVSSNQSTNTFKI